MELIFSLIIIGLSIAGMIYFIIFLPKVKIGKYSFDTFYWSPLVGAIILLIFNLLNGSIFFNALISNDSINPLKILCLFLSMTCLSVVLDEVGLFKFLAEFVLKYSKNSQMSVFIVLYITVSFLTIFTSNDIIILTFTPFIIFFAKNAKISPIPYLVEEFVAANTFSMLFIIGNPTNIYLATSFNVTFFEYLSVMWLPTIFAGLTAFIVLLLIFYKRLKKPIQPVFEEVHIIDKPILIVGLIGLIGATILLIISSYIGLEMYLICLISALLVLLFMGGYSLVIYLRKKKLTQINLFFNSVKRLPYTLIPFLLSMFAFVLCLNQYGVFDVVAKAFSNVEAIFVYGITSFMSANLINNIPMSVLFANLVSASDTTIQLKALYASVIGSNIGAYLTPIGALAGIMWMSILKKHEVKFSFLQFVAYGTIVSIPTLFAALGGLAITLL
jgi:arsenical pump membrane protein